LTNQVSLIQLLAQLHQICEDKGSAEFTITKKLFLLRLVLDYVEDLTEKELQRFFKTYQTSQAFTGRERGGERIYTVRYTFLRSPTLFS
jgi:hypothetical protein